MDDRDPRVDPRPGDVLRGRDGMAWMVTAVTVTREPCVAVQAGTVVLAVTVGEFHAWFSIETTEVLHVAR